MITVEAVLVFGAVFVELVLAMDCIWSATCLYSAFGFMLLAFLATALTSAASSCAFAFFAVRRGVVSIP